jgi:hypothetical protein
MANEIKTQGTHLYFVKPGTPTGTAVKVTCPTGISGLGGPADQIDTTCLDDIERAFVRGLGNPGQVTVPFVLKAGDASHEDLFTLKDSGDTLNWMICMSDGTDAPTVTVSTNDFAALATRSNITFAGYVSDMALDGNTNEVWRGTLTIQRSGGITVNWKA